MNANLKLTTAARIYFGTVIVAGCGVVMFCAWDVFATPKANDWWLLGALTALTGSFTVRIPRVRARISVSDAFVFASVLLFGPSTSTVIVAFDCIVMMLWRRRSALQSAFNLSATALSIWLAAHAFFWLAVTSPGQGLQVTELSWPLFVLAAVYFAINSSLVAIAIGIERGINPWQVWTDTFPLFSINYFAGVSAAALLVSYAHNLSLATVGIILPLLVISYLTHRASLGRVQDAQRHVDQLNELYMSTIEALAMAVDAKDQITHGHIRRVQVYAVELAKRLGVVDERQLKGIETAALLHDMGKLAIPEHILNKPGKLTPAEFEKMKRHSDIGADLLASIKFPYPVVPIVRHHHECWDGRGYPAGISGTDIPLGARILAVVDCFDALNSDRPYRPLLTPDEAFAIIRERRGTMYDPLVVDTFISAYEEISPAAIRAGQEARSIVDTLALPAGNASGPAPLRFDRDLNTVLSGYRDRALAAESSPAAFEIVANGLRELTPATVIALFQYDERSDSLICGATAGDKDGLLQRLTISMAERIVGWAAAARQSAVGADAVLDLSPQVANRFTPPLKSAAVAPIMADDIVLGVLASYSPATKGFNENHRHVIDTLASALAERRLCEFESESTPAIAI